MSPIDKIYYNFEKLHDNFVDLKETKDAIDNLEKYLEENEIDLMEAEPHYVALSTESERQGFVYGFQYAVALLTAGNVEVQNEN